MGGEADYGIGGAFTVVSEMDLHISHTSVSESASWHSFTVPVYTAVCPTSFRLIHSCRNYIGNMTSPLFDEVFGYWFFSLGAKQIILDGLGEVVSLSPLWLLSDNHKCN